jgi:hypothetical protein
MQDHLLSFQKYTEDDVIYWMDVAKGTKLWYHSQFGDGAIIEADFIELRMKDRIPVIYCSTHYGVQWGYLAQFKKCFRKLGI